MVLIRLVVFYICFLIQESYTYSSKYDSVERIVGSFDISGAVRVATNLLESDGLLDTSQSDSYEIENRVNKIVSQWINNMDNELRVRNMNNSRSLEVLGSYYYGTSYKYILQLMDKRIYL